MSISVKQLKKILGSFSQAVAKDVSGIKTGKQNKLIAGENIKITEDGTISATVSTANVDLSTYATKQEVESAVANVHIPSIEGLAKEVEVEATYAKKSELPSVEGLAKEVDVETKLADYAKTSEVAETYATKAAVNAINGLDADTIATLKNLSEHSDLTAIANKVDNVYTKVETDNKLAAKADVTAIPDVSGLATKQEVTDAVAGVQIPSIEGLAKTTDVDTKLESYAKKTELPDVTTLATKAEVAAITIPSVEGFIKGTEVDAKLVDYAKTAEVEATYAKKTELPDVSGLATKAEVEALKTDFVTEEILTQNINQFSTNVDDKINEAKGEIEAKVTTVDTKLADYAKKTELPDISGLATKAELPSIEGLAKTTEVVAKSVYDTKVAELESTINELKSKLSAVASGTTEQRPSENLVIGQQYFDTTLGVPVYWNGTEWHNPFANITTVEVENH